LNEQVSDIRWSPDGQWLVFASDYGGNERRDLYRVPANGGAVEKLTETKLSESAPRFSPDGKRITFTADPDQEFLFQLHVLDLETRKTVQLTHEPVNVLAPVWSLDGRTIAITRSGDDQKGELLLVNASTGAKVVIEPPVQDGILWPETFSPDGQKLLLTARNEAGFYQLAVLELADAARRFENWYETEMGNPKADAALFRERSPLLYLDDIKVPLLIFQGTNDSNVPKSESDLLVAVLEALKKPYEYVVYEDEGHGFTKRKNLLDHYRRTVEFFTKHLKPKE
jgi:dipeptidyl aminopeptidase/acylaminoacyl peptidase